MLIEGWWSDEDRTIVDGAYRRPASPYGSPMKDATIRAIGAEPGRFHLVASLSCPWSHRSLLTRALKGLEGHIPLHFAGGPRSQGYRVGTSERLWTVPGTDRAIEHLHELYALADPGYTGRATVALLWDAERHTIVSNESIHILRGLDAVRTGCGPDWTLRPNHLKDEIDALADRIQRELSNAVYRAGKAQRQDTYDAAVEKVFVTLDMLDARLATARYLHGNVLTETDLRLWPTLARFDAVYHGHFKCARRRLTDYQHLWAYARDILSLPGVTPTFDEHAIRLAYYGEDRDLNPYGIVATAPDVDWHAPHGRDRLEQRSFTLRNGDVMPWEEIDISSGTDAVLAPGVRQTVSSS
ncbi:glutathione S-transferase C-terminal domain-containing protein [Fulvimarina sp. MAC8]|uniref:glutathione S-transferase family protein n=1 Tax=Fulvimarina sp. MAC8 TaxID=3162874 RepID=UPI0032EFCFFC